MSISGRNAEEIEVQIEPREALASLGYAGVSDLRRVTGGWGTLLWQFTTPDGQRHSLRVHHLPPRHQHEVAWRERLALETCARAGLPAPRLEKAGEVAGFPAMVLSWCPGTPLMSFIEKKPWAIWRLGRLFGQMQARVHAVTPPAEFVATAPDDWVSRVTEDHADLVAHASSLNLSTASLIHIDFHPLNLISDGTTITGIIDWTGAAAGDPRADLARTEVTLLTAPIPPGPLRPLLNFARKIFLMGWRSGYTEVAGLVPDYRPLRAWAGATLLAEMEFLIDRSGEAAQEIGIFYPLLRRWVDRWAREAGIR